MTTSSQAHDDGAVATEYAIMASLIAVVIVGSVTQLGNVVIGIFNTAALI